METLIYHTAAILILSVGFTVVFFSAIGVTHLFCLTVEKAIEYLIDWKSKGNYT